VGSQPSLLATRLTAQRLSGAPAGDAVEATRHLLAVQAQDLRGAQLAIRARTAIGHAREIDHELSHERSLIITWVNRGTLHLIAAEDEPFLHALTTPQLRTSSSSRLRQLGVSDAHARRGGAAIVKALSANGPMTREQLREALRRANVPTAGQVLVHLLFRATIDGLIVRGPMIGSQQAFVLVADWLGERPKVDQSNAGAELARRYLVGHGPAGERDLARWAQIPLREARAALEAIASELDQRSDGLVDLKRRGVAPLPPPKLLGPWDPLLCGWREREFVLGDTTGVITINGIFKPIALVRGRAVGTWALPKGQVELELWNRQPPATAKALAREAHAIEAFLRD
jgi:hypothetical protein